MRILLLRADHGGNLPLEGAARGRPCQEGAALRRREPLQGRGDLPPDVRGRVEVHVDCARALAAVRRLL
eukprot:333826-Pyramimonas_sp.AAC.1